MKNLNQAGLTIVELLVMIGASSIIMATITGFALNYWTNTAVLQNDEDTLVTRMNVGDYIRNQFNSATGLISQNDLADSHTLAADPGDGTGTHWLIIHAIPGTATMPTSGYKPLVYFSRPSLDTSKNMIMNGSIPYQDNVILYMNGNTKQLLSRTIANPSAANNRAKTTCPPAQASSSCPSDKIIAEGVSSVGLKYFSRSGTTIDYTSAIDGLGNYIGPDFPTVEVVELNLGLNKKAQLHSGANTSNQTIIRVALRN